MKSVLLISLFFFLNNFNFIYKAEQINLESFNFNSIHIKVLLSQISTKNTEIILISSNNQIILRTKEKKQIFDKSLAIYSHDNKFFANNIEIKNIAKIDSSDNLLNYNGNRFSGSFYIIKQEDNLLLINRIELEEYIFSVLHTESWPGWPLEVNKAFAIASRSYVISKLIENKNSKNKNLYHVKNTNKHQTYRGINRNDNILREAVDQTRGIILGYNKIPILAMFDICCGGIIPAQIKNFDFDKAPYLARKQKCDFCKKCKLFTWQAEYCKNDFEDIIKKELPKLKSLQYINIIRDRAGLAQKIEIKERRQKFVLTGKRLYSLFNKIKSFCFSISKSSDKIIINGKGYGHHLGICQWGAREMVNQGYNYIDILKFYYPKCSFMKLQKNTKDNAQL